jgi:hypothetical protein
MSRAAIIDYIGSISVQGVLRLLPSMLVDGPDDPVIDPRHSRQCAGNRTGSITMKGGMI